MTDQLIDLCDAQRNGQKVSFAIHDCLIELGFPLLAKLHFSKEVGRCHDTGDCQVIIEVLAGSQLREITEEEYQAAILSRS